MTFSEKLKLYRQQAGMSQEKLAEKIGVSRQAITKWETNAGIPDIENMIALSSLFDVTIDELLSVEKSTKKQPDYLYESVTEYDIDCPKRYDLKLGGAKFLKLSGYNGEKIRIRLASNTLQTLSSDFKLKIDDVKNRIDIDISRKNGATEAMAKEAVNIYVQIPASYIASIECRINAETVEISALECEDIELDLKTVNVILEDVVGTVEMNCNLDMNILCRTLNGGVEVNQVSATSRICVPEDTPFSVVTKGIATSITYEKNKKQVEPFCIEDADNVIELNGIKSELVICTHDPNTKEF